MKGIRNWRTTLWGFLGGIAAYITLVGDKIPQTGREWAAFAFACAIAGIGAAAKDGQTGSAPGAADTTNEGGMAMKCIVFTLLMIGVLSVPVTSQAGLVLNPDEYQLNVGVPSLQTDPDNVQARGGAIMANYGHLANLELGPNVVRLGFLTAGIGFQSSDDPSAPMTGKQVGGLLFCTTSRQISGEVETRVNDICVGGKYDFDLKKSLLDIQLPVVYRAIAAGGAMIGL